MGPEERLSQSVNSWLSASGAFVVPAERANGDAVLEADSLVAFGALSDPLAGDLFAITIARQLVKENCGVESGWLVAVVLVFSPGVAWAVHGAVAAADSLEAKVALNLESGRADLLALAWMVGLASLLGWSQIQTAGLDCILHGLVEGSVNGQDVSDLVGASSLAERVAQAESLSQALVLGIRCGDDKCCQQ